VRLARLAIPLLLLVPSGAWAHSFPKHQQPAAGETLERSPSQVVIEFDRTLDGARSSLRVEDEQGLRVDRGDAHLSPAEPRRLTVGLVAPLPPGRYHVFWVAVGRDGHRTEGDYRFRVR